MINSEATGYGGVPLNIGSQTCWLHPTDARDLTALVSAPDGGTWAQAVYVDADGSTVRTVLAHRHGNTLTVAIGLDGVHEAASTAASALVQTLLTLTQAGAR